MKIPLQYCNILECLAYEKFALSDLIAYVLKDGLSLESDNYKKLFNQYKEVSIKYELAKKELAKIFNIENRKWKLNFNSQEVIFLDENQ